MIDINELPSLPIAQRSQLPPVAAIYFAIDSLGNVQYIGRSVNLQKRWLAHHRQSQLAEARIAWLTVDSPDLLPEIEAALIEWFDPPLNGCTFFESTYSTPLKLLRERVGLRTVDIASILGVAESTVRNWDTGKHSPRVPIEDIPRLLDVYQVSLEEMIQAAKESRKQYEAKEVKK